MTVNKVKKNFFFFEINRKIKIRKKKYDNVLGLITFLKIIAVVEKKLNRTSLVVDG